jgi:hypothetical protein
MAYGFKTVNANGSIGIDSTETACRFVAQVSFLRNFNGTISVPDFDINRGGYTVTMTNFKFQYIYQLGGPRASNTAPMPQSDGVEPMCLFGNSADRFTNLPPTTSWNNTTKLLSVTTYSDTLSDWRVLFLHYK